MAVLAHALQIVGGWIAPLVIFLVKKDSLFVRFHALQALLLQGVYLVCAIIFGFGWMIFFISAVLPHLQDKSASPPAAIFAFVPVLWLFIMGYWVVILVCVIVFSIKAGRGEWAEYPLLGRLARKFLKMDVPPGTQPTPVSNSLAP
jgi:uncharacterized membrane protein